MSCENNKNSCNSSSCSTKCCPLVDKMKSSAIFQKVSSCPGLSCLFGFFRSVLCLAIRILLFPIKLAMALFILIMMFRGCDHILSKKMEHSETGYHSYSYVYNDKNCHVEIKDGKVHVHGCGQVEKNSKNPSVKKESSLHKKS